MNSIYHSDFISAIHAKTKVRLTFNAVSKGYELIRLCAPLDYGPKAKAKNQSDRYHFWDYESENGYHPLSILPEEIIHMEFLTDTFDTDFIYWSPCKWHVIRRWGIHS